MQITELGSVPEIWKPVLGYEGLYEVSNEGRVRALFSGNHGQYQPGRLLKPQAHKNQYLFVTLYRPVREVGRGTKHRGHATSVHSLVLEAFKGPRPDNQQCRHLDGVRTNNCLVNLAWGTCSENREDSRRHGTITNGERNGFSKLSPRDVLEIRRLRDRGVTCDRIADKFAVHWSNVWLIGKRKTWKHVPEVRDYHSGGIAH